jgi:acyl dehydratase
VAIDYHKLKNWDFAPVEQTYDWRYSAMYALGVGYGYDPLDTRQLAYVYEDNMVAAPTMPVVLASPGFWVKEQNSGIDWVKVLHGEQSLTLHKPLPVAATVVGELKVTHLADKGAAKGALMVQERKIYNQANGDLLATLEGVTFCRGDGGFSEQPDNGPAGGDALPPAKPACPTTAPDAVCELPTLPQQALWYRLCSDLNPLHADPAVAQAAGFKAPILHGLASYGLVGHALLRTLCDYDASRLKHLGLRFAGPVYPGESLRVEMWHTDLGVQFQAKAVERDVLVISHGLAHVEAAA